jgi:hypothetical protein
MFAFEDPYSLARSPADFLLISSLDDPRKAASRRLRPVRATRAKPPEAEALQYAPLADRESINL